jgi:hypothetical protein
MVTMMNDIDNSHRVSNIIWGRGGEGKNYFNMEELEHRLERYEPPKWAEVLAVKPTCRTNVRHTP